MNSISHHELRGFTMGNRRARPNPPFRSRTSLTSAGSSTRPFIHCAAIRVTGLVADDTQNQGCRKCDGQEESQSQDHFLQRALRAARLPCNRGRSSAERDKATSCLTSVFALEFTKLVDIVDFDFSTLLSTDFSLSCAKLAWFAKSRRFRAAAVDKSLGHRHRFAAILNRHGLTAPRREPLR